MMIRGLPFSFDVRGDTASGTRAELSLEVPGTHSAEQFDQTRCVVSWFAAVADAGGFGGATLPPSSGRGKLANSGEPVTQGGISVWSFDALCVAPEALVCLGRLLADTGLPIGRVTIKAQGADDPRSLTLDDTPGRYPRIEFPVDEDRTSRYVEVSASFAADLADVQAVEIADLLKTWCLLGSLGAFRSNDAQDGFNLVPEDDPEVILDEIAFTVSDRGAEECAYHVLVNLLAGIHRKIVSVASLTIH